MELTGGEIVAEHLIREGVPYVIGIPGHGCLALVDAFRTRRDRIATLQVRHEQSAVHMADGYYRVARKPLAVFSSIGPGAMNLAVGLATAYVDSTAVLALTGQTHTYMFGRGVLQEVERLHAANSIQALAPLAKRHWQVTEVVQLPGTMQRAFNVMLEGRPGPVVVDLPMNVQADAVDVALTAPRERRPGGRIKGDPAQIERAAELLVNARRPVILAGGGVLTAAASAELRDLAEFLGAAVITTTMGKSAFPEDHPLYGWHAGAKGTTCGNALARSADVIFAVGCRFADETTSSYRHGVSFAIPPTRLIHADVDGAEIGKNYPTEVGIVGDAQSVLADLLTAVTALGPAQPGVEPGYAAEIAALRDAWFAQLATVQRTDRTPVTISRFFHELRGALDRDAIVATSSGHPQAAALFEFPFYAPGTNLSTGGFSTMGFAVPAAMGAKLAAPDRQVVAVVGDGDFMMTMQELATAAQYGIAVVVVVLNNQGWQSIRDLQIDVLGEASVFATEFTGRDGTPYSPSFRAVGEAFGIDARCIQRPDEVQPAIHRALALGAPALIEVMVDRTYPYSGGYATGWWDVPVPAYLTERRAAYLAAREEEMLV
jgi:acetolactate synthase I/II/III large subunit